MEVTGLPADLTPDLNLVTALYTRSALAQTGSIVFPDTANVLNQLQASSLYSSGGAYTCAALVKGTRRHRVMLLTTSTT